jgi:zinc protease
VGPPGAQLAGARPPAPSAKPGPVTLATLDNGLRLLVREDPGLPVASAALVLAAGSAHDHPGREGGLTVLANTLTDGAGGRGREEIDALLDQLGGHWDLALDREFLRLGLTVASEDLAAGVELLADLALHPTLADSEIEKERDLALAGLRSARDRASWRAEDRFRRAAYGDHAYAHPPEGTETGLGALGAADVLALHRELFLPRDAVLAIVGDVTAADARRLAEERFGGWAPVPLPFEAGIPALDFAAAPGGRYEEALDRQQVQILVGARGPARLAPGYVPCMVLRGVIGMRNFRELVYGLNLVYETRMVSEYLAGAGALALYAGTAPGNREAVEREFAERIRAAREEPVPADELARIQTMLIGRRALEDEATGSLAASLARYEVDGRGFAYYDRLPELIRQVSAAEVMAVAREVLAPERLITVVVGPAAGGGAGPDPGAAGGAQ